MFIVKRKGAKVPAALTGSFKSYEKARSAVRKYLRKTVTPKQFDVGFTFYGNPSIGDYGYSIEVA